MKLRPLGARIVVIQDDKEIVTPGGIALPQQRKVDTIRGKVVAVGSGDLTQTGEKIPVDIQVGDIVVFPVMASIDTEWDGEQAKIVREADTLGVVV